MCFTHVYCNLFSYSLSLWISPLQRLCSLNSTQGGPPALMVRTLCVKLKVDSTCKGGLFLFLYSFTANTSYKSPQRVPCLLVELNIVDIKSVPSLWLHPSSGCVTTLFMFKIQLLINSYIDVTQKLGYYLVKV